MKRFETEEEAIKWVQENTPFLIRPKREGKYQFIQPFRSGHAMMVVTEGLGKRLFALPDVMPSLQQDDSYMLFHECPNCNCRCNCTYQPCSCCNRA